MLSERTKAYYDLKKRNDIRESAKRIRRQFLRYKDAEIVYSLSHKMLLGMASKAGAIYRMDNTVLINRDVFDAYLEQFHEPSTLLKEEVEEYLRILRAKDDAVLEDANELYIPSKQGTLVCDADSGRFRIRFDVEEYSDFLLAGTILEVLYHGEWILTRFDMIDTWVLEDIPTKEIAGLIVRI